MRLCRCFAWDRRARPREPGGALWFARAFQGDGRHDNPEVFGCLYTAEQPMSAVVEQLARFRGTVWIPELLLRRGLPLALASLQLDERGAIVDLDSPPVLTAQGLRPSRVATRQRAITQPQALAIYRAGAAAIRWWSTFESLWTNVTVFDRASRHLRIEEVRPLGPRDEVVLEAGDFLGMTPG